MQRILLVDDEPDIRRVAELTLRGLGAVDILGAASGEEALAMATRHRLDLILLDVMMPGLGGLLTLQRLKETHATAQIPVVMMTARASRAEQARYLSFGAAEVVVKPFDLHGLTTLVSRVLGARSSGPPGAAMLEELRADFVARLPTQLEHLEGLVAIAAQGTAAPGRETLQAAAAAHRLRGTAGSYGLARFADAMDTLETLLVNPTTVDWEAVKCAVHAARRAIAV